MTARRGRPRLRLPSPQWWLSENWRTAVSVLVGLVLALPVVAAVARFADRPLSGLDLLLVVMTLYLAAYVVLTVVVHHACSQETVREWSRRQGRGTWFQRYVSGTAPGPGLSIVTGTLALVAGVVWMPRGELLETVLPVGVRIPVALSLIVVSWTAMMLSFAVAYRAEDLLGEQPVLRTPEGVAEHWSDYVYVATSLSTSFSTGGIEVRDRATRRTVTAHAVVAFIYNTVIVGAVVSAIVSL